MRCALFLLALVVSVWAAPWALTEVAFTESGVSRRYLYYLPPAVAPAARPLVLILHGGGGSADGIASSNVEAGSAGWFALADREGFALAFLEGTPASGVPRPSRYWNAGNCAAAPCSDAGGPAWKTGANDHAYVLAAIDSLAARVAIDRSRVYAAGVSNGGMMVYALVCDSRTASALAAVALTAGTVTMDYCNATVSVPMLVLHSRNDGNVPYNGGTLACTGAGRVYASVAQSVGFFASRFQCSSSPTREVYRNGTVSCEQYLNCLPGSSLTLCTVEPTNPLLGGHNWLGHPPEPQCMDASRADCPCGGTEDVGDQTLWNFFAQHSRAPLWNSSLPAPGEFLWSSALGDEDAIDDQIDGLAMNDDGSSVIAGVFRQSLSFRGVSFTNFNPGVLSTDGDVFVFKLSRFGDVLWSKQLGSASGDDNAYDCATDASQSVYLSGWFQGNVSFGGPTTLYSKKQGMFVVKYNSLGEFQWQQSVTSATGNVGGNEISVTASGEVAVAGMADAAYVVNGRSVAHGGNSDGFVLRIAANGTVLWVAPFNGAGNERVRAVEIAEDTSSVWVGLEYKVSAWLSANTTLTSGFNATSLKDNGAIVKLRGTDGQVVWAHSVTSEGWANTRGIANAPNGGVYAMGYLTGAARIANVSYPSFGSAGIDYLLHLYANGTIASLLTLVANGLVGGEVMSDASGVVFSATLNGTLVVSRNGTPVSRFVTPGLNPTSYILSLSHTLDAVAFYAPTYVTPTPILDGNLVARSPNGRFTAMSFRLTGHAFAGQPLHGVVGARDSAVVVMGPPQVPVLLKATLRTNSTFVVAADGWEYDLTAGGPRVAFDNINGVALELLPGTPIGVTAYLGGRQQRIVVAVPPKGGLMNFGFRAATLLLQFAQASGQAVGGAAYSYQTDDSVWRSVAKPVAGSLFTLYTLAGPVNVQLAYKAFQQVKSVSAAGYVTSSLTWTAARVTASLVDSTGASLIAQSWSYRSDASPTWLALTPGTSWGVLGVPTVVQCTWDGAASEIRGDLSSSFDFGTLLVKRQLKDSAGNVVATTDSQFSYACGSAPWALHSSAGVQLLSGASCSFRVDVPNYVASRVEPIVASGLLPHRMMVTFTMPSTLAARSGTVASPTDDVALIAGLSVAGFAVVVVVVVVVVAVLVARHRRRSAVDHMLREPLLSN